MFKRCPFVLPVAPFLVVLALLVGGCSIGGDGDDSADVTPTDQARSVTATSVDPAPSTATEEPTEPDPTPTDEPTPTSTMTPEPTATSTPEPTPTATPEPVVQDPFAGLARPDSVLDNYTLTYTINFEEGLPEAGMMDIFVEQFAPDNYHIRAAGDSVEGVGQVEIWVVGATTYFRTPDGQVSQVPGQMDQTLFSPSAYLILTPDLATVALATDLGVEDIDGRAARHYRVDPEQLEQAGLLDDVEDYQDPEGHYDVWIDEELGIVLRMIGDAAWSDDEGTRYVMQLNYELTNVNSTPEIQPPA